jgi:capsular exopolysaccharide synthesis family protein
MSDISPSSNPQNLDKRIEEFSINYKEILKVILRRWYGIVSIIFVCLISAWFNYTQLPPEYHASSLLMIKQSHGAGDLQLAYGAGGAGNAGGSGGEQLSTDIALLKSTTIGEHVVKELYRSERKDSLEFFGKRHFVTPMSSFLHPRPLKQGGQPQLNSLSDRDFSSYTLSFQGRVRVVPIPDTNLLQVSVASPFAEEALFLTNTLCKVYKDSDKQWNSEKYTQSMKYISELLKEQQKKVDDADIELVAYQEHNELATGTADSQQLLTKISEIDTKYNETISEYNIVKNNLNFLETKLSDADKALSMRVSKNVTTQLGAIQDEIKSAERAYVLILRDKKADDPEAIATRKRLDLVKSRYEQLSRSKIAGELSYAGRAQRYNFDLVSEKLQTERKLNELVFTAREWERRKQVYETRLNTLPQKQQTYFKLKRQQDVVAKTYLFLQEKLEETSILLGSEIGKVVIVGDAIIPVSPEKPPLVKKLIAALLTGLLLAALFAIVSEFLDDTVSEPSFFGDIGLTVLSILPLVDDNKKKTFGSVTLSGAVDGLNIKRRAVRDWILVRAGRSKGKQPPKAEPTPMPKITDSLSSQFSESFRTLRTALDYSRIDSSLKSILVTGTAMSEGKSTACANLGMAYALTGKKTLVIDCDLRRASMHKKFERKREPGLTDYLFSKDQSIEIFFQTTPMDNLFLLSAGKRVPNHNELLGSPKMGLLIKQLEVKFDKILLDTPPLFLSDATQLARTVDGILLVVRLKYSGRKPIQEFVKDSILGPLTLGVVAIAARDSTQYGYGNYGYNKYGYKKYGRKYGYSKYGYTHYEEKN